MADESTRRSYQSNDPYSHGGQGHGAQGHGSQGSGGQAPGASRKPSDPLAELARLIGQTDPYTENAPRRDDQVRSEPEPLDWRKAVAAMPPFENLQPEPDESRVAPHRDDFERGRDPYYPGETDSRHSLRSVDDNGYDRPFPAEPPYPQSGHYEADRDVGRFAASAQEGGRYADNRYDSVYQDGAPRDKAGFDTDRYDRGDRDGGRRSSNRQDGGRLDTEVRSLAGGEFYQEGSPLDPRDGAMYDDPPRSRGRNGLITAVTLVACAVVGTAAAYGYRTYVGGGGSKVPPIITAETTPSKVPASFDPQSNKSIQDRVREQGERLVSREEQPIDIRGSGPRQVLPSPYAPTPSFGNAPGGGNQPAGAPRGGQQPPSTTGALTEPKSVRTIPIRPDGTDVSGRPVTGSTPATAPARPGTAQKNAQAGRSGAILADPQAPTSPANGQPARERELSSAPPNVPDPPRLASAPPNVAPAAGPAGAYMVQLSSQKSEGEAQSSFRSLQAKYPEQLGSRSPVVRRADLGDKGVFYRAMVGPFGSSEEATRFCSSLKAAGGNCLIQRN